MSKELQHKLSTFEATPPASAWAAITDALDHQQSGISERLAAFTATPPENTWEKIASALDTPARNDTMRIPRYRRIARYATAAAAVLAIAFIMNIVFQRNATSDGIAVQPAAPVTVQEPGTDTQTTTPGTKENNIANRPVPDVSKEPPVTSNSATAQQVKTPVTRNRYVSQPDDNGRLVRMSKKVAPVINCAEKTAAQSWSRCKESVEALQARLANAAAAPTDFAGLMDMIKSLEENR